MNKTDNGYPPKWADKLFAFICPPHLLEELQGDLHEQFILQSEMLGERKARQLYVLEVLKFIRPYFLTIKPYAPVSTDSFYRQNLYTDMLCNYFTIAFRSLVKNNLYSSLNIAGLSLGMAVALLIGLWIYNEITFNQYHQNYNRIARVLENVTYDDQVHTSWSASPPLGNALRSRYGNDFTHVLMASHPTRIILSSANKSLMKTGYYFEPGVTHMLSLQMRYGNRDGLKDPTSILLSTSLAASFFGNTDPVGELIKLDNSHTVKVTGVFESIPANSDFAQMSFILPWSFYVSNNGWIKTDAWWQNGFQAYVQVANGADMAKVSSKIKDIKLKYVNQEPAREKQEVFLHPMNNWHLYSNFENGKNTGGRIGFIWLYGSIGIFVLLLACINFINLNTARSSTRAKEVGIRKAIGSLRSQLIGLFLSESLLVAVIAFVLSLGLVEITLPLFNEVSGKQLSILWSHPSFWLAGIGLSLTTGLIAGVYPAFYLSSFQPVKVLKGTFRVGRSASTPRQILVILQFTVSISLIIGTIIVFRQVQYGKNRPVGYSRDGLIMIETPTGNIHTHFNAIREELTKTGAISEISESLNSMTGVSFSANGYDWDATGTHGEVSFATVYVDHNFGKTVSWQFKEGRDFSREFSSDSSGIVLNETAVAVMGLTHPIGKTVQQNYFDGLKTYRIIGVIKDMLMESPFEPVRQTVYKLNPGKGNVINLRIHPAVSTPKALSEIETIIKKYDPSLPFEYRFVEEEYAQKFKDEERISKIVSFFSVLAIMISCMGIFGLASFVAGQRVKEIGIRKVLGATVFNVWGLLSRDFVILILIALLISIPVTYYFLSRWLENYTYRTDFAWWIFALSGLGALLITMLTVSYQSIKAALANPVKSLRNE